MRTAPGLVPLAAGEGEGEVDAFDLTDPALGFRDGRAAGADPVAATVHAIDELIGRDALSPLLIGRFLRERPTRLVVVDPAPLPDEAAVLLSFAGERTGRRIHLIGMTTDLGVPADARSLGHAAGSVRPLGAPEPAGGTRIVPFEVAFDARLLANG
ncbi:YcaO-like family protein [Streptomyces sp. NPDC057638]|uniref:YcaO-like family protein n=1 Tax=Streptomyces sp. NPDC057638 TaxID=3346190 RepID=UPI0036969E35